MIELYHWEDDPEAERLTDLLEKRNLDYKAHPLDPEIPNARPYADYNGKTYWDLSELIRELNG